MSTPTLFVCKSCNAASQEDLEPSQGTCLFNRLNELHADNSALIIQGVECLWMCERACVVAVCATARPTYLFTDLPHQESSEALLAFVALYLDGSETIPFKKIPQVLSANIARIPSI